jgi:hypothetical protein
MKWLKKVAATPLTSIARVVDSLSATTNDRTNAPSIHAVREAVNNNWLSIYPIGSIYMNVNDVNPSTIFGGTWEKIEGKFLLSSSNSHATGTTGGAETFDYTPTGTIGGHSLTVEELAIHYHVTRPMKAININDGTGTARGVYGWDDQAASTRSENAYDGASPSQQTAIGKAHNHSFTGTAATINKMPPYITVNVWKRTA